MFEWPTGYGRKKKQLKLSVPRINDLASPGGKLNRDDKYKAVRK
jgi:hypothetical protein